MDMVTTVTPARIERIVLDGTQSSIYMSSKGRLKIQTTGKHAEQILDARVPDGKNWEVTIKVTARETLA